MLVEYNGLWRSFAHSSDRARNALDNAHKYRVLQVELESPLTASQGSIRCLGNLRTPFLLQRDLLLQYTCGSSSTSPPLVRVTPLLSGVGFGVVEEKQEFPDHERKI